MTFSFQAPGRPVVQEHLEVPPYEVNPTWYYYADYSITDAPSWWLNDGLKLGWYYVQVPDQADNPTLYLTTTDPQLGPNMYNPRTITVDWGNEDGPVPQLITVVPNWWQ